MFRLFDLQVFQSVDGGHVGIDHRVVCRAVEYRPAVPTLAGSGARTNLRQVLQVTFSSCLEVFEGDSCVGRKLFGLVRCGEFLDLIREHLELGLKLFSFAFSRSLKQVPGGNAHSLEGHCDIGKLG